MAYNNGFPTTYQPYYPQYMQQSQMPQIQPQQQTNGIIWVQGEAGAKSYLVAPNNTVQLWDSESQTIYLKSADASGMPSMRILDYTIRQNPSQIPQNITTEQRQDTPTRQEINALQIQIDEMKKQIEKLGGKNESTVQSVTLATSREQSN